MFIFFRATPLLLSFGIFLALCGLRLSFLALYGVDFGVGDIGLGSQDKMGTIIGLVATGLGLAIIAVGIIKALKELKN